MAYSTRLTRPNQTWALAKQDAFVNPLAPTTTELNNAGFVSFFSCALTEDGTSLTLGDSETDDTLTFCSIGNESTPTFKNPQAQWTFLKEANTGGSGSTVDLTSLYNKAWAWLAFPDVPYWVISRTGPNASQDIPFAIGHKIKMALFTTDYAVETPDQSTSARLSQSFLFNGGSGVVWNYQLTV
jgi:hypothetical protein